MGLINKLYTFVNGSGNLIDATQVNADLDALYTLLCGAPSGGTHGQLSKENIAVAFANGNVEPIFALPKTLRDWGGQGVQLSQGANAIFGISPQFIGDGGTNPGAVIDGKSVFDFDPADYPADGRSLQMRIRAVLVANSVSPAINFTFALAPIVLVAGGSGVSNSYSPGAAVTGSTFTISNPGASGTGRSTSGWFAAPASGLYALYVQASGNATSGNRTDIRARLDYRHV